MKFAASSVLPEPLYTATCEYGHSGYYRIQGPVVMIEFDQHSGVFLSNKEPAKLHIHTIVRTPNDNDYGAGLLRMHYEARPPWHPLPARLGARFRLACQKGISKGKAQRPMS
jgi:Protein of unknown function (DUF3500)